MKTSHQPNNLVKPDATHSDPVTRLLLLLLISLWVAAAAFVEIFLATPMGGAVYLILGIVWAVVFSISVWLNSLNRVKLRRAIVVPLVLAALYAVPWNSRKVFLRDLHSVQPGMSLVEAERIMEDYSRGTGWPACPLGSSSPTSVLESAESRERACVRIYRHSDTARFDSDWGLIYFDRGRVTQVSFSPD